MAMRHKRRHNRNECGPKIAMAFGVGLFVAFFFSTKLALVVAAIALIYVGACNKTC